MPTSAHTAQFMCIGNKGIQKTEKQLRRRNNAISGFTFAHTIHKNQSIGFHLILVINTDAKEYDRNEWKSENYGSQEK